MIYPKILIYIIGLICYFIVVIIRNVNIPSTISECMTFSENLVYDLIIGIISGFIVYVLTVKIPHWHKCRTQRPILHRWLADLYSEISSGVSKIPITSAFDRIYVPCDSGMFVLTPDSIGDILDKEYWCITVEILESKVSIKKMMEYYLESLRTKSQSILNIYSDVLNANEIRYLNTILTSDVYARLHFLESDKCKNRTDTIHASMEIKIIMLSLWRCADSLKNSK